MSLDCSTKRKQSPPAVRTTIVAVNPHRPRLFQSSMPIFLLAASPKYMDLHPLVGQDRIVFLSFVGIREHVAIIFNFSFLFALRVFSLSSRCFFTAHSLCHPESTIALISLPPLHPNNFPRYVPLPVGDDDWIRPRLKWYWVQRHWPFQYHPHYNSIGDRRRTLPTIVASNSIETKLVTPTVLRCIAPLLKFHDKDPIRPFPRPQTRRRHIISRHTHRKGKKRKKRIERRDHEVIPW